MCIWKIYLCCGVFFFISLYLFIYSIFFENGKKIRNNNSEALL